MDSQTSIFRHLSSRFFGHQLAMFYNLDASIYGTRDGLIGVRMNQHIRTPIGGRSHCRPEFRKTVLRSVDRIVGG